MAFEKLRFEAVALPDTRDRSLRPVETVPVAQFQNKDRIKIVIRTVEFIPSRRKQKASESALHRVTQRASRIPTSPPSTALLELIQEVHYVVADDKQRRRHSQPQSHALHRLNLVHARHKRLLRVFHMVK